ncbi:hypothetical protein CP082626L3_0539B, partial [Chlamydia psittaci 08-2626_L3]
IHHEHRCNLSLTTQKIYLKMMK